jgi:hypothetical protein
MVIKAEITSFNRKSFTKKNEQITALVTDEKFKKLSELITGASIKSKIDIFSKNHPTQVLLLLGKIWPHIGNTDGERADSIAQLLYSLYKQEPSTCFTTHIMIWLLLTSENKNDKVLCQALSNRLRSLGLPLPIDQATPIKTKKEKKGTKTKITSKAKKKSTPSKKTSAKT